MQLQPGAGEESGAGILLGELVFAALRQRYEAQHLGKAVPAQALALPCYHVRRLDQLPDLQQVQTTQR